MKSLLTTIALLFLCINIYSQPTREWFIKDYPIDGSDIRKDNHSVVKAKVISVDKKRIKSDYLIKIEVDTVYWGKVDSSILLVNVAMPFMSKKGYKKSQQFINTLQGKSIIMNLWKSYKFKDNDKHRKSLYWTSAYPFFYPGLIDNFKYVSNRSIALFLENPSLFIVDIGNYYPEIESFIVDFYKAMQPDNCELLLKFLKKNTFETNNYILTFLYSASITYISNCKCE